MDGDSSSAVYCTSRHSASVAACRHGGDSASLRLSNGDRGGSAVVLETESSVKGLSDDEVEGAEEGADLTVFVEGRGNASSFGRADVNAVAETGRDLGGLTLSGGFNDQNVTSNTLATLDDEVNIEGRCDNVSVETGANSILERSSGRARRRAGAGGSGAGASSAGGGAVADARLDGSESDARSSSAAAAVDRAVVGA